MRLGTSIITVRRKTNYVMGTVTSYLADGHAERPLRISVGTLDSSHVRKYESDTRIEVENR